LENQIEKILAKYTVSDKHPDSRIKTNFSHLLFENTYRNIFNA